MAHRTDGANNVANLFSDGGAGVPGTTVEEDWLNMVQEELCGLIEACGITLVKGTNTQLLAACVAAATANKIVRRDASGRAKVADGAAADDIATKGQAVDVSSGSLSFGTGWQADGGCFVKRSGKVVSVHMMAAHTTGGAWTSIATIPAGFRPTEDIRIMARVNTGSGFAPGSIDISAVGNIAVYLVLQSGAEAAPPALGAGCGVTLQVAFHTA